MASLILRAIPYLIRILRAGLAFKNVLDRSKIYTVIRKEDLKHLIYSKEDIKKYVMDKLFFDSYKTHRFIFFSEKELKEYVYRYDNQARINKVIELFDCSLYMVELDNVKLFLDVDNENFFVKLSYLYFCNYLMIWFNYFLSDFKKELDKLVNDLRNYLIYLVNSDKNNNDIFDYIENRRNYYIGYIEDRVKYWKEQDIQNTYCLKCSCCCSCSCEEGSCSCCCSCVCNLVHFIESWDRVKQELENEFNNVVNQIKNKINYELLDKNNKKSYYNYIYDRIYNKEDKNSFRNIFLTLLAGLLANIRNKSKAKLLFAVINKEYLKKEFEKEKYKKGILRYMYEYLRKNYYGEIVEYDKLIKELKKALEWEFKKEFDKKTIQQYLSKINKRYMRLYKYKIDGKYKVVVGYGKSRGPKQHIE